VATSTVVRRRLEEELIRRGHKGKFTISQCKAVEVPSKSKNADLCVSTIANSYTCHCPLVVATNLIVNRNTEEIYNQIEEVLFSD
jgi:galactitol-specific phosphotransferase system IIB component